MNPAGAKTRKRKSQDVNEVSVEEENEGNMDEPSLLAPPTRRGRYSDQGSAATPTNVTTLTPIATKVPTSGVSPAKEVIEIVLSDDDDEETPKVDERKEPSTEEEVIEKSVESQPRENENDSNQKGTDTADNKEDGKESNQFVVEEEIGDDNMEQTDELGEPSPDLDNPKLNESLKNINYVPGSSERGQDGADADNWLNAAGNVVLRGHKKKPSGENFEVIDLSSHESAEVDDSGESVSTNFEEESEEEEPFFTISAIQSIPVGVFRDISDEEAMSVSKSNTPSRAGAQVQLAASFGNSEVKQSGKSDTSPSSTSGVETHYPGSESSSFGIGSRRDGPSGSENPEDSKGMDSEERVDSTMEIDSTDENTVQGGLNSNFTSRPIDESTLR